ncbi:DoxX family protein [Sorangium sp. So ce341]|uniref:DoxX family protein n=1 Tax=Sorangium sp. So ce341 TaxID=3133302 RepID=UPI003F64199A
MIADTIHETATSTLNPGAFAWLKKLTRTSDELAPVIARVALGAVIFPHGAQKALGWFGGPGLGGTMAFMTGPLGIPAPFVGLAIAAEFLGAIGLITGTLSRVAAFGIAMTMLVAVVMVHASNGFFMNWLGSQKGEGFEYHLLAIGLAAVVMAKGAGRWSIDRSLSAQLS